MPTLQGFYSRISTTEPGDTMMVGVQLNPDHEVYEGHFPHQPVAPGAALLQMIIDEAAHILGGQLRFLGARQIKFLSVLNPLQTTALRLEYTFTVREGQQEFTCVGKSGETLFFKINGAFG